MQIIGKGLFFFLFPPVSARFLKRTWRGRDLFFFFVGNLWDVPYTLKKYMQAVVWVLKVSNYIIKSQWNIPDASRLWQLFFTLLFFRATWKAADVTCMKIGGQVFRCRREAPPPPGERQTFHLTWIKYWRPVIIEARAQMSLSQHTEEEEEEEEESAQSFTNEL